MNAIDLGQKNGKLPILICCMVSAMAVSPVLVPAGNLALRHTPAKFAQQPALAIPALCTPQLYGRHLNIDCTESAGAQSLGQPEVSSPCGRAVQLAYNDEYFSLGCAQEGFTGYFAPSRWDWQKINGDGGVDVTGAPDGLLVEGANSALVSVDAGSLVQWRIAIPAEGYAVFGWRVVGGSNLFSVLVNEQQVLVANGPGDTDDRFFSPLLHPGDRLTLQLHGADSKTAALQLSQFRLLTNATGVTCRTWTATDDEGESADLTQFITYTRPSIAQLLFPAAAAAHPDQVSYPVFDRDGNPDTSYDQYALNETCGYRADWTDEVVFDGVRCVLKRHWLVSDDCGGNTMRITQVIDLPEAAGDCPPAQPGAQPAAKPKAAPGVAPAVLSAAY